MVAARDKPIASVSESRNLVYRYRIRGSRIGSDGNGTYFTSTWGIVIFVGVVVVVGIACFDPLTMRHCHVLENPLASAPLLMIIKAVSLPPP